MLTEENEILIAKVVEYEKAFAELFRELDLKPAQCELIRAFLIFSNGQIEFEASKTDLAQILYKTDGKYDKTLNSRVGYYLKVLKQWQKDNNLTLVGTVEPGGRTKNSENKFVFIKTKYRFGLLAELSECIAENPENLELVVKQTVAKLKEQFTLAPKTWSHHPNRKIRDAKNTIFTKLKVIFRLAIEADGDSPYVRCYQILMDCWDILNNLNAEYTACENRDKFITEFERKLKPSVKENSNEEWLNG